MELTRRNFLAGATVAAGAAALPRTARGGKDAAAGAASPDGPHTSAPAALSGIGLSHSR